MSDDLELSLMVSTADERSTVESIQPLLTQFEAEQHIHVRLRLLSWDAGWSYLIKVALYGDGPDVSEIGSTWLGDLIAMNALHAFDEAELNLLGKAAAFLPAAWLQARLVNEAQTRAIPWLSGARLVFYRRDLLHKAGVDPQTAFQTAADFERALRQLDACGVPVPWTVPTGLTHTTLLNVASWVWSAGGDFVSPDGKRTTFNSPQALSGIRAYLRLGRYLAPSVRHLNGLEPDRQFLHDDGTALTLTGSWLFGQLDAGLRAQLGVALPLGVPFVGGSHLVVWKYSEKHESALRLIAFLTQAGAQVSYSLRVGLLPAVMRALLAPPFATEPLWQTAVRGLRMGRSFPVIRSWGLMEDRLTTAFAELWAEVLAEPALDLDAAIAARLEPLAQRLDLVLGQS